LCIYCAYMIVSCVEYNINGTYMKLYVEYIKNFHM